MSEILRNFSPDVAGWQFMWTLLIPAAFTIAIAIERAIYILVKSDINADTFMKKITQLVRAGEVKEALNLCERAKGRALPQVVSCGLRAVVDKEEVDFRTIQNSVDEGMLEVIPKLEERTHYLAMWANVATLIGLMGTIYGLILAFRAVSAPGIDPTEKARLLAMGISAAMNTTLSGLAIAVPATLFHSFLLSKTKKIIDEIDEHTVKLINLLTGNR
ncbi:MotA/TolQ/ExbB proton channel family protein [candidate division KSB1 bacterium]|jgi:biopolymer transport protein ExbB/TolQ|nr:MotA/TolQ/ExbB proton channel family protein [candidate division KSB1 bacterium]